MGVKRLNFAKLSTVGGVVLAAGLCACSHASPPPPQQPAAPAPGPTACPSPEPLRIKVRAAARLNLSDKGEPLATVVRVYQLKGTGKISAASFDDRLDHEKAARGEAFGARQEPPATPGPPLAPPLVRSPEATHIAIVA